jgi:hypothetical protein
VRKTDDQEDSMSVKRGFGAAGLILAAAGFCGCVSSGFEPIAITRDQAIVSSCQNLGDVSVPASKTYDDSVKSLMQVASTKKANYLLITSAEPTSPPTDDSLRGVAYRCSTPATAPAPGGSH